MNQLKKLREMSFKELEQTRKVYSFNKALFSVAIFLFLGLAIFFFLFKYYQAGIIVVALFLLSFSFLTLLNQVTSNIDIAEELRRIEENHNPVQQARKQE